MESNRTALGVGILTATAALLGAAGGAYVTLEVSDRQADASIAAEQRTVRAEVYQSYLDAAVIFYEEQMRYASSPADHCTTSTEDLGLDTKPLCLYFDFAPMRPMMLATEHSRRRVLIYGSSEAVAATAELDDYVSWAHDPSFGPFSETASEVWMAYADRATDPGLADAAWDQAWDGYLQREAALLLVMCQEVSATPTDCAEFEEHAGTPTEPAPTPAESQAAQP